MLTINGITETALLSMSQFDLYRTYNTRSIKKYNNKGVCVCVCVCGGGVFILDRMWTLKDHQYFMECKLKVTELQQ